MSDEYPRWRQPSSPPSRPPSGENFRKSGEPRRNDGPAAFTPDWYVAREAVLADIARKQRGPMTDEQRQTARLATELAVFQPGDIGYAEARRAYEEDGLRRMQRLTGRAA